MEKSTFSMLNLLPYECVVLCVSVYIIYTVATILSSCNVQNKIDVHKNRHVYCSPWQNWEAAKPVCFFVFN